MTLPEEQRCKRKLLFALSDFRRLLSEKGAAAFTRRQRSYLARLVSQIEKPETPVPLSAEEKALRNKQVSAFFAFLREQRAGGEPPRQLIDEIFTSAFLSKILHEIRSILRPYGLESEAEDFVYSCAANDLNLIRHLISSDHPPREYARVLFVEVFNPNSDSPINLYNEDQFIGALPKMLARELDGIPAHATEIVREKLNYIEMILHGGSTSIRDVSGGAPGSGKGGVANH